VVDGAWTRAPEEFVRRVDAEETRTFLGNRVMRVPAGSAGVVVVDGVVERVLPPGQQTAISLFGRIANFFTGRSDRTALYLVDLRPLPIPFAVRTRLTSGGQMLETQVLVTFHVERNDPAKLGAFLEGTVGARNSYGAVDLFQLLRPEVTQLATSVLERLSARGEVSWSEAEATIRREIAERIGGRWALDADVTVAPLSATTTIDLRVGAARLPPVRACAKCKAEVPATMKFCDRCGTEQPAPLVADRSCPSCDAPVGAAKAFCESCGKPVPKAGPGDVALLTSDGHSLELDVVVRVRGPADALDRAQLLSALAVAAASHARTLAFAGFVTPASFEALEAALRDKAAPIVASQGLEVISVSVVDVRSASGDWILQARADLNRARAESAVGREWLAQRADEVDLLGLTLVQDLARKRALLADRQRQQEVLDAGASLDVADARRESLRQQETSRAERATARAEAAGDREDEISALDHSAQVAEKKRATEAQGRRQDVALASEAARARADDAAYEARKRAEIADLEQNRQIAKLEAMAQIDRRMAEQEHAQTKEMREMMKDLDERRIIALQAAELAKSEGGGAAWAEALGGKDAEKRLEQAERHAAEMRAVLEKQADRIEGLADRALDASAATRKESTEAYGSTMDAMSRVAASRAASPPVVAAVGVPAPATKACPSCGASVRADAQFCGSCGKGIP
jgi:hypothetical protein